MRSSPGNKMFAVKAEVEAIGPIIKPSAIPIMKPMEIFHISGNFSFPRILSISIFKICYKDKQKLRYFCVFI